MRIIFCGLLLFSFSLTAQKSDDPLIKKWMEEGKKDSVVFRYKQLAEAVRKSDKKKAAKYYLDAGEYISKHDGFPKAVELYSSALELARSAGDHRTESNTLRSLGWVYKDMGKKEEALGYINNALDVATADNDTLEIGYCQSYLASYYSDVELPDSAFVHLRETAKIVDMIHDSDLLYMLRIGYGLQYYNIGKYDLALNYFVSMRNFPRTRSDQHELSRFYTRIGIMLKHLGRTKEGLLYLDSARIVADRNRDLNERWNTYYNLSRSYYEAGMYKEASEWFVKYEDVNDSVNSKANNDKMAEMQAKYDVQEANTQVGLMKKQSELINANLESEKKQKYFLIGIISLAVIIMAISFFAFRNAKRKNALLQEQKDEIVRKTDQLKQQAAEIARSRAQMNPHFIFNALNSVQGVILKGDKTKSIDYVSEFSKLMRSTLNNSDKEVIMLEEELKFLDAYVKFEQSRYENGFEWKKEVHVNDASSILIPPMIIQPFLENAIKHGLATKANGVLELSITENSLEKTLSIVISDNGVGRSKKENASHTSRGMEITLERIHQFHETNQSAATDQFSIEDKTAEGKPAGTGISINLPLVVDE